MSTTYVRKLVRLRPDQAERLRVATETTGAPANELIRRAIDAHYPPLLPKNKKKAKASLQVM